MAYFTDCQQCGKIKLLMGTENKCFGCILKEFEKLEKEIKKILNKTGKNKLKRLTHLRHLLSSKPHLY